MNRMNMANQMYARGEEVSSGMRSGSTGPNVQRGSLTLPAKTLSRMGALSRGGIAGLIAAGGLGLFELGRQTGFEPEKLGQAAAQVQKSLEEVADEAVEVARQLGEPVQDFVNRVVAGYQTAMNPPGLMMSDMDTYESQMAGSTDMTNEERSKMIGLGDIDSIRRYREGKMAGRMPSDMIQRNLIQQQQLGFAAGDEVDIDALPKGLKAMYDSGPKGREGVEKIAAKTDKFAEGGAVENEIDEALSEIQSVQPEAMVIQQVMTMVMEMIQSGASEEQIMQALMEMGLDQEDIQQVMMMVAEEMAGQDSIDGQLAQMM